MRLPEEQSFSPETEREFDEISEALAQLFSAFAKEYDDFEIYEHSAAGYSIDLTILNYRVIKPADVEARLEAMVSMLRRYQQFWCIRFWLYRPTDDVANPDQCIWLEITKYGVAPYRGKKDIELFSDMESLYKHYWGEQLAAATPRQ
jgi:hypothetical protein